MSKKGLSRLFCWSKWIFASVFVVFLLITLSVYLLRDKIVGVVVSEVNKHLNTPVNVGDVDLTFWASFPNLSVDFNEVFIPDAVPEAKKTDTLFYSKKIRLKFNPIDIINKKYKVNKIEVFPGYGHVKHFADGQSNFDILKPTSDTTSSDFEFTLKELYFTDFRMDYSHFGSNQFHSTRLANFRLSGDFTEKITDLTAESNLEIICAQSGEVKLVQNKTAHFDLNLRIDREKGLVSLPNTPIQIANLPFIFGLDVDENIIDIRLKANNLQLVEVAKNLKHAGTKQISNLKGSGAVKFDFHYSNERKENEIAKIECYFGVQNGNITEPKKNLRISNINLNGFYGNTNRKLGEHLSLENLNFQTIAGPFTGNILITEFSQPHFQGKALGQIDLAIFHAIFPIPLVQSTSGKIDVDSKFDVKSNPTGIQIRNCDGNVDFANVQCQLVNDKRYFDHITGRFYWKDNIAGLQKMSLTVGNSDLLMDGKFEQLQDYLNNTGKLIADVKIRSAFLDVQDFSTSTKAEEIANGRNFVLPNDIDGNLHLLANNLTYDKHEFKKLSTELVIYERNLHFKRLSLQNSQADISGNVLIQEKSPEIFTISTNAHSDNISFQPVFAEWDNFQQNVISADNISGKVSADLQFSAPFDLRSGIKSKDISATIKIKIDDGRLKNVEAFKSITASLKESTLTRLLLKQNNIQNFENNLLDLKFARMENTFVIANGRLTIPKMTIASNAMTVNLSGTHDFDNQLDYHFNFNLRDIKKSQTKTEFGEILDDDTGLQLFAHMFGPMDNPTIKWDQQAKRELVKANIESDKQTTKEMLKADFGLFKKDTTIRNFQAKEKPQEEIQITFGKPAVVENTDDDKVKKDTKMNRTFQKWKDEAQKNKVDNINVILD
jgi:hypothetical protein